MTSAPLETYLQFALQAAWQAGRYTLGFFQTGITAERKADDSPVTAADRGAEQLLRELIERYWPDHGIIGEEFAAKPTDGALKWTLDPIDGTKSFVQGVPIYANLLALTENMVPIVGVVHFPALNETVYAVKGGGCFWNGRRTQVSTVSELSDAVLLGSEVSFRKESEAKQRTWERLVNMTYIQRTWGDSYGYALVATGRADVMLDPWMAIWDCGPLQVVLEEAGGTFTDWRGTPTITGGEAIATNGVLAEAVMAVVREEMPE